MFGFFKKSNFFWFKFSLLFLMISSFIGLIFFSIQNKTLKFSSHIPLNFPQAYNDRGFNQKIIEGVCNGEGLDTEECNRTNEKFSNKISFAFSGTVADSEKIKKHIDYFIKIYGVNKIVLPGFTITGFLKKYIKTYNEKIKFIGIDTYYSEKQEESEWPKNLWQANFLHYYSGYHAGIYASAWASENSEKLKDADNNSENGKQIHFSSIGGLSVPAILKYSLGFKIGIYVFNKFYQLKNSDQIGANKVEFIHNEYEELGSFNAGDPVVQKKARMLTENLFASGTSIVFMIAVPFVSEAVDAAVEQDQKSDKKHFIIGVDVDAKKQLSIEQSKKIITSAIIDFRKIVKNIYDTELNIKSQKGKDLFFGGHEFATIPNRYKEDEIWNKYFSNSNEYHNISELNNLPPEILGEEKPQIANLVGKTEIDKIIKSDEKLIYSYLNFLVLNNKIADYFEYKKLLRSEDPIEYMKNKVRNLGT